MIHGGAGRAPEPPAVFAARQQGFNEEMKVMKRLITLAAIVAIVGCVLPASSMAQTQGQPQHANGSLGFHSVDAPVGVRWWFMGQKIGLDLGFGLLSSPAPNYDERLLDWTLEFGVPIVMMNWERVHLLARPGVMYTSEEVQTTTPPDPFGTDERTTLRVAAEIEAEVFLVDNFSVSASHGISVSTVDPAGGGDSDTFFGTLGNNFTNIGFHIYFFGGNHQ